MTASLPQTHKCAGTNKKGRPCGSRPAANSEFCIDHQQQVRRPAARRRQSSIAAQPPTFTTLSSMVIGTALTLAMVIIPENSAPAWAKDYLSAKAHLVSLCIASMILAVFILTYQKGQHWLAVSSTLSIGICTWAAALIPFRDTSLWQALGALIFTSPLTIAIIGTQIAKLSIGNIGLVVLVMSVLGILLMVVIDGTAIGRFILPNVGPQVYLAIGAITVYASMIGLLFALLVGAAKLRGIAMTEHDRGR